MENSNKPAMKPGVRGWLLLFAITLVAVAPLVRLIGLVTSVAPVAAVAEHYPKFVAVYGITCVVELALIAWSIAGGVAILRMRPGAPGLVKLFLLVNPIALFVCTIAYAMAGLPQNVLEAMTKVGANITSKAILYSIIWGLYLKFSRRVRETFPGCRARVGQDSPSLLKAS
jgi:uncharacterized protein DUF2569